MSTEAQTTTPAVAAQATLPLDATQTAANAVAAQAAQQTIDQTKNAGAVQTAEQIAAEAATKTPPAEVVYALTLPKDAAIEADAVERLTAFAKANSLSPETAQKALEHANAEVAADRAKQTEANTQAFQTLARETWVNELKADKEFGGEKFDATVIESKRAADRFITAEEKKILDETGWGNHPLLVRIMARVGRGMGNDTLVTGGGMGGGSHKSTAELLYGGSKVQ